MEYVICFVILILVIILLKLVFKVNLRKIKELEENESLTKITDRFPGNIDVAKDYLKMLNNPGVKIQEAQDTKTSLYIAVTNKIIIADLKNNYARLQVIAHECIHSIQDRTLLLFNFIISNILILYFLISIPLVVLRILDNIMLQLFIITFISLLQFGVRSSLEIDAMLKSKNLVKEYMDSKQLTTKEEAEELLLEYEKINKIGIPFVIDNLLTVSILRILVFVTIGIVM